MYVHIRMESICLSVCLSVEWIGFCRDVVLQERHVNHYIGMVNFNRGTIILWTKSTHICYISGVNLSRTRILLFGSNLALSLIHI